MQKSVLSKVLIFIISVVAGLWTAGFFDGYAVQFGLRKTFSRAEVQSLLGKNVRDVCYKQKAQTGKIFGSQDGAFGDIQIKVKWENDESSWTTYSKGVFESCVVVGE